VPRGDPTNRQTDPHAGGWGTVPTGPFCDKNLAPKSGQHDHEAETTRIRAHSQ